MDEGVFMAKGPKFNEVTKTFTTRDNLGIESATAGIQDALCPIVTTVTPRAFYWPFVTWNYYDYHVNCKNDKKNSTGFNDFLNRNSYFMVLANMMMQNLSMAFRASFLAMSRQGLFYIPLVLILPHVLGFVGIQMCQAISDVISFVITVILMIGVLKEINEREKQEHM